MKHIRFLTLIFVLCAALALLIACGKEAEAPAADVPTVTAGTPTETTAPTEKPADATDPAGDVNPSDATEGPTDPAPTDETEPSLDPDPVEPEGGSDSDIDVNVEDIPGN